MDIQDVKEYNKIVIEVSKEMSRPWKWSTIVLALLLAGMMFLYFVNPSVMDIDQDNVNSVNTQNNVR